MKKGWQNFFTGLENYGKAAGDMALSAVGANDVIDENDYKGNSAKFFTKATDIAGSVVSSALPLAANIALPGSGMAVSALQKGVGMATNSNQNPIGTAVGQIGAQGANIIGQAQDANQYANMFSTLNNMNIMAYGGTSKGIPQLEKEEVFQTPQGYVGQVDAPTHSQGGINLPNMPNNTRVFSDRLTTSKGKTYAEEASKYTTDKWQKILDNPNSNSFAKSTAERMMKVSEKMLDRLFKEQEGYKALKGISDDGNKKPNGGIVQNPIVQTGQTHPLNTGYKASNIFDPKTGEQIFYGPNSTKVLYSQIAAPQNVRPATQMGDRYSGQVGYDPINNISHSKFPNGGTFTSEDLNTNPKTNQAIYQWTEPVENTNLPPLDLYDTDLTPGYKPYFPSKIVNQIPTNPINPQVVNQINQMSYDEKTPMKNPFESVNPYFTAATAGNFLGPAYDIYRGLKGPDEVNFDRINPDYVSYEQARQLATKQGNQQFQSTKKAIQQGTGGGAGTYLSNVGNAAYLRDKGIRDYNTQSLESEKNLNVQIGNQAKAQNAGIQMQESIARQQEKDIAKNTLATGLYNLGAALNTYGTDMQLKGNEPILMELIKTGDYEFVTNKAGKPIGIKSKIGEGKITGFSNLPKKQQEYLQKLIDEAGKVK